MDMIILGLLMLKRLTVYEIRSIIGKNFREICSDSMGSIQAAIKKLLVAQMITYTEYVEKSVNKKRYSITGKGREAFSRWVGTPADLSDTKNMEIGKLLFMGFVPAEKRLPLIDEMIGKLEKELSFLQGVQYSVEWPAEREQVIDYWDNDHEYREGIQKALQNIDMTENAISIGGFQLLSLEYGIDCMKFNIEWFKKLRKKAEEMGL